MALKFDENGLIPAIVQDFQTKQVLTLAYMNEESLAISLAERRTCFWARSRQQLWRKGEESGNVQHIVSITADCDEDALLVQVCKEGPACHTGQESCFFQPLFVDEQVQRGWPDFISFCRGGSSNRRPAAIPHIFLKRDWIKS